MVGRMDMPSQVITSRLHAGEQSIRSHTLPYEGVSATPSTLAACMLQPYNACSGSFSTSHYSPERCPEHCILQPIDAVYRHFLAYVKPLHVAATLLDRVLAPSRQGYALTHFMRRLGATLLGEV